jgi:hypothetical protein
VIEIQAAGFPRWKLRTGPDGRPYRDVHQAVGSVAVLSNRRSGTLEVTVEAPGEDPDKQVSPWEAMSGAAVWAGGRIVAVVAEHHRREGLGRLTAARLDRCLRAAAEREDSEHDGSHLADLLGIAAGAVLPDVLPPPLEWLTRSGYQKRVRDLTPEGRLRGRDTELDELAAFCAGDEPYAWWQARSFAGKTALMATFALDPPAGVEVLSFFVTRRAGQRHDSSDFITEVIEQLSAIAGTPAVAPTPSDRTNVYHGLLADVAATVSRSGRRLVLVVDGLDEDRSADAGLPGIASLLPKQPPADLRIIVTSRHRGPVNRRLPQDHPLRRCRRRRLSPSPHASEPTPRRLIHRLEELVGRPLASGGSRRRTAVLVCALIMLVPVGVAVLYHPGPAACPPPVVVRVSVAPGVLPTYRNVAAAYERWTAARNDGCRTASLYIYPASPDRRASSDRPGSAGTGNRSTLGDTGLHPDLWLPGPSATVDDVRSADTGAGRIAEIRPVATTPLLLAVPAGSVGSNEDNPERQGRLPWPQLFEKATQPAGTRITGGVTATGWQVVRPDPTTTLVGRLATTALYAGVPERTAETRQRVERWIEQAQDAGAYPPGDDTALLCRQRELAASNSRPSGAIITTEQMLVQYNLGRPLGTACTAVGPPAANARMVAFYPAETPEIDHLVVRLDWGAPVQDDAVRMAAADFSRWITNGSAGEDALLAQGLRPASSASRLGGGFLDGVYGVRSDWPFGHKRADPTPVAAQSAALDRYDRARRPGLVLIALDASGSMRAATADGRRTRFEIGLDGVRSSLARMGGDDEFALWLFSTAMSPTGTRTVAPIGRLDAARATALEDVRRSVVPTGDTPLYRAIEGGIRTMRAVDRPGPEPLRAVVVLTDGQDTASGAVRPEVPPGARVRVFVIAIGEASCAVPALARVTRGSGGECLTASADNVDRTLTTLFRNLWETGAGHD